MLTKTIRVDELAAKYKKINETFWGRIKNIFGINMITEYKPYKTEYLENKIKHIQNRSIIDFFWFDEEMEKGYIELDNGYIITETTTAMFGTGNAGLNYYETLEILTEEKGKDFTRLSKKTQGGS